MFLFFRRKSPHSRIGNLSEYGVFALRSYLSRQSICSQSISRLQAVMLPGCFSKAEYDSSACRNFLDDALVLCPLSIAIEKVALIH